MVGLPRDLAVRTGGEVYLFAFKVVVMAPEGGVELSRETRNVTAFEVTDG